MIDRQVKVNSRLAFKSADRLKGLAEHASPAESLSPPPQAFNQNKDQFRAAVIELYREGVIGSPDILRILYERGFRNGMGKSYYRNDVRNALKDAGVVE